VQHTNLLLLGQGWRRVVLASRYFARYGHGSRKLGLTRKVTTPRPKNPVSFREMVRILHDLFPHPVSFLLLPKPQPSGASENKWRACKNDCIKMQEAVYLFQS
jgi:hypothetical protein